MIEYQIVSFDIIPYSWCFGGDWYRFQYLEHLEHLYSFALDDKDFSKINSNKQKVNTRKADFGPMK